jgi:hypothetical protein
MKTKMLLLAGGLTLTAAAGPVHSLFNPAEYTVLTDSLVLTNACWMSIHTQNGTNAPSCTVGIGATTNGTWAGRIVTNQAGSAVLALFSFGSLALSNGVTCTVTGNLGVVFSSPGDITIGATVDVSGAAGASSGSGASGAEGGARQASIKSAPPGSTRGNGGSPTGTYAVHVGVGYGAGRMGNNSADSAAGAGAGYGGAGGKDNGSDASGIGAVYGSDLLPDLYGGSGGGGSWTTGGNGGGGGGALELIANGTLTIGSGAVLRASGGAGASVSRAGGGGSGGGIILAARYLTVAGTVQANGGSGGSASNPGGGGGGGRIAFYANHLSTNGMVCSVAGGAAGGGSAAAGTNGTFRYQGDGGSGDLTYPFVLEVGLPSVAVRGSTNLGAAAATVFGEVLTTGGEAPDIACSWWAQGAGTTNREIQSHMPLGWVTNQLGDLTPNTQYYYTYAASNSAGIAWASGTNSFTTYPLTPTLVNAPPTDIGARGATANGYLLNTGLSATAVCLYWGTSAGALDRVANLGVAAVGAVSNVLGSLAPNTQYYYRFAASNAAGWGYAPTTNGFVTAPVLGVAAQTNSLWNPARYPRLADNLVVTSGTVAIDTGDGTNRGPSLVANGQTYRGQVVPNQRSNVWVSLFNFGALSLGNVSCIVTGNLGLVLASQGDMAIGTTVDVSGVDGGSSGAGGPGADNGIRLASTNSAPPGSTRGNGGSSANYAGRGYGAGTMGNNNGDMGGGGGGGYGGAGGKDGSSGDYSAAGAPYGTNDLSMLLGGSGGGASWTAGAVGGGGGGALELIANGTLTVGPAATLRANGGAGANISRPGGGGSGGAILLAARKLVVAGTVQAGGGNGGQGGAGRSGGGGGGRVACYANLLTTNGMTYSVAGGATGGGSATAGSNGTFFVSSGPLAYPYATQGTLVVMR